MVIFNVTASLYMTSCSLVACTHVSESSYSLNLKVAGTSGMLVPIYEIIRHQSSPPPQKKHILNPKSLMVRIRTARFYTKNYILPTECRQGVP
jgi:hypothetical protein